MCGIDCVCSMDNCVSLIYELKVLFIGYDYMYVGKTCHKKYHSIIFKLQFNIHIHNISSWLRQKDTPVSSVNMKYVKTNTEQYTIKTIQEKYATNVHHLPIKLLKRNMQMPTLNVEFAPNQSSTTNVLNVISVYTWYMAPAAISVKKT